MRSANGNVPPSMEPIESDEPQEIRPGDFVRIKPSAFDKVRKMTPKALFKIGWPNKFFVLKVYNDIQDNDKLTLELDPCCRWMINHATGQKLCFGHHAEYFDRIPLSELEPNEQKGDRHASVDLFGWEAVSADYHEREKAFVLKTPLSRSPVVLTGEFFKKLVDQAKDLDLF